MARSRIRSVTAGLVALIAFGAPAAAEAAPFNVDTTADHAYDGCNPAPGDCTLRDAITDANTAGTADAISLPAGSYVLANAAGNLPEIAGSLDITGAGAATTNIDAGGGQAITNLLRVNDGGTASTVNVTDLTLRGVSEGADGAAISIHNTNASSVVNVTRTVVRDNENASGDSPGILSANAGTLNVLDSSLLDNVVGTPSGGVLEVLGSSALTVTRTLIAANRGPSGTAINIGFQPFANSIENVDIRNSTISGNSATNGPVIVDASTGGVAKFAYNTITANTPGASSAVVLRTAMSGGAFKGNVISGNSGANCDFSSGSGPATAGFNFDDGTTCKFVAASDRQSTPVGLGPLADNAGPTLTHALGDGSAAIDAGGANCTFLGGVTPVAIDQRQLARPQGPACDSGAFERWAGTATADAATNVTANAATLNGTVNPSGIESSVHFEYGLDATYGSSTPTTSVGTTAGPVSAAISGLAAGTIYHYRVVATSAFGTATSADATFTTSAAGGPPPPPDTVAPLFLFASVSPKAFAVDPKGAAETPVKAAVKKGTTFTYTLSEAARVVFTIQRATTGRKVRRRCVRQTKRNRRAKRCRRYVTRGRFAVVSSADVNTHKFSGRIGRRKLAAGRYRAVLVATDLAGNASKPKRVAFRIVPRRKR